MCKGLEGYGNNKREEGRAEGALETLVSLVRKGLLAMKDAAGQAEMSPEEFQEKMQKM